MNEFTKPEYDQSLDPVTYFNQHRSWQDVFQNAKHSYYKSETEILMVTDNGNEPAVVTPLTLTPPKGNLLKLPSRPLTRFSLYNLIHFSGNYRAAMSNIEWKWLNKEIPYIRVGTDYFRIFAKTDRYGIDRITLKPWKKDEIKSDHGQALLKYIHRYNDFVIQPNNISYERSVDECFNLYAPFPHVPYDGQVLDTDIPVTLNFMTHIFGDQLQQGLKYMKALYEHPKLPLPVLCLVSAERQTGKTTFNNYINILFGDNFVLINPEDLLSSFNASYATKNIICIDETVIDKTHSIEKLKSIATAKTINVNQKHVSNYAVPFFGKVIISTNKETDFIKIDQEEIRFWIRKIKSINTINTNIEQDLIAEIPMFLTFLRSLPAIDTTRSRMVLTAEEIYNNELATVKQESQSSLYKELTILLEDHFQQNPTATQCHCNGKEIKDRWFHNNHSVSASYICKVIKQEFKIESKQYRYSPFNGDPMVKKNSYAFCFERSSFIKSEEPNYIDDEIPF